MGKGIHTIKEKTEAVLTTSKDTGLNIWEQL